MVRNSKTVGFGIKTSKALVFYAIDKKYTNGGLRRKFTMLIRKKNKTGTPKRTKSSKIRFLMKECLKRRLTRENK